MYKKIIAIIFCIILLMGCLDVIVKFKKQYSISEFYEIANEGLKFDSKTDAIFQKVYDAIQILLGKKEIGNFTYYRNKDTNGLMLITSSYQDSTIEYNTKKINNLNEILDKDNIPFIYINMPPEIMNDYKAILKDIDYSNIASDELVKRLEQKVNYIDMKENETIINMKQNCYKTDHHYNMETTFETFKTVVDELNNKYKFNIDTKYTNIDNYKVENYKNTFFGSKGVNVGYNYIKREDFKILMPKYETDFEYTQYTTDAKVKVHKKGSFNDALVEKAKLTDYTYINKYNAFLYGGNCENIIINKKANNNKRLLLISSSYGRSFTPYISQCFYETRYIDPQKDRFEKNILKYIEDYKPDMVIMLYKAESKMIPTWNVK